MDTPLEILKKYWGFDQFRPLQEDIIKSVLLCAGSFGVVYFTKIHPILVIIAAGIIGYFIFI